MQVIQTIEMPALPVVEEVDLADIEDELLSSSKFVEQAWFLFSSSAEAALLNA